MRNLHFWSAQFLVIVSAVHLLRVILTGAYAPPRRFNYLLGMGLLVLAVLLDFTGYVLRWDEGIHWALVTGTNLVKSIPLLGNSLYTMLVGGAQPGPATLIRFYGWHIFGLTLAAGILVAWHIFRVRRDGGIAVPPPPLRQDQIAHHALRAGPARSACHAAGSQLRCSCFPLSLQLRWQHRSLLPPHRSWRSARAPWFFLWVQQMLKLGNPFLWGVVVPLAVLVLLSFIPYIFPNRAKPELGRWFPKGNRLAQIVALFILLGHPNPDRARLAACLLNPELCAVIFLLLRFTRSPAGLLIGSLARKAVHPKPVSL